MGFGSVKIKILESAKEDLKENEVRIYAVIDCRRDPTWIRRRMQ